MFVLFAKDIRMNTLREMKSALCPLFFVKRDNEQLGQLGNVQQCKYVVTKRHALISTMHALAIWRSSNKDTAFTLLTRTQESAFWEKTSKKIQSAIVTMLPILPPHNTPRVAWALLSCYLGTGYCVFRPKFLNGVSRTTL